jgi:hypothetical protein
VAARGESLEEDFTATLNPLSAMSAVKQMAKKVETRTASLGVNRFMQASLLTFLQSLRHDDELWKSGGLNVRLTILFWKDAPILTDHWAWMGARLLL